MINMMRADLYRMSKSKGILFFWLFTALIYFISIAFKAWGGISLAEMPEFPENTKTAL